jgi:hypothetical protein
LQNQKSNPDIINLVNVVPHRQYWNGFLLNKMQDYPEGEESNVLLDKGGAEGGGFVSSTTLTTAGPLFNRNYFGTFTDQFIEYN